MTAHYFLKSRIFTSEYATLYISGGILTVWLGVVAIIVAM